MDPRTLGLGAESRDTSRDDAPELFYYSSIENKLAEVKLGKMRRDDRLFMDLIMQGVINRSLEIPQLPLSVLKINKLLGEANVSFRSLSDAIKSDQKLMLKVLETGNAAIYGPIKTTSLELCVSRIGMKSLRGVVAASMLKAKVLKSKLFNQLSHAIWMHNYAVGVLCQHIAKVLKVSPDTAFLCGFFHDFGKLVLLGIVGEIEKQRREDINLSLDTVKRVYEVIHPDIGALIATLGKLDPKVVRAIENHHNGNAGDNVFLKILTLANACCHCFIDKNLVPQHVLGLLETTGLPIDAPILSKIVRNFIDDYKAEQQMLVGLL